MRSKTTSYGLLFLTAAIAVLLAVVIGARRRNAAPAPPAIAGVGVFTMDPLGAAPDRLSYIKVHVALSPVKPAEIRVEPHYRAVPKYATIHIGDGPKATYTLALDEPANGDYRIYFDGNRDGDLTNDGDGKWRMHSDHNGATLYGANDYIVRASYGSSTSETSSSQYGVAFYRIAGTPDLIMFRTAARKGEVTIDGKAHKAMLIENDGDALYSKPIDDSLRPLKPGQGPTNPVWLGVDFDDGGKLKGPYDVRSPFKLGDVTYVASVLPDGSRLTLQRTTRPVPAPVDVKPLTAGMAAPEFEAVTKQGAKVHLSDYRGKVVILDFWATWCGPCQQSMPHLEAVYESMKNQGVVVLGICVLDGADKFKKWMRENGDRFKFPLAYDPAGTDETSILSSLYHGASIPMTVVVDRQGKISDIAMGYGEGDDRVELALQKLGMALPN